MTRAGLCNGGSIEDGTGKRAMAKEVGVVMSAMLRVVMLSLAVLLSTQGALAQTIFRTDFEDAADWSVSRPFPSGVSFPNSWTLKPGGPSPQPPKKIDGSWLYPNSWTRIAPSILPSPSPTPMATIGAGQGKGGSRGMVYNVEVSGQLGIWSGGSPLVLYLGAVGYSDLYVSMWVKYDPLFTWLAATPTNGSQQKLVYISRLNEILSSSSDADNHSNGPLHPSWLPHWFNYISASPFYAYYANRSQLSNGSLISYDQTADMYSNNRSYYPQGGPFKWPESMPHVAGVQSDGQWHHYQYHVKMNSTPGAVDGVQEVWLDGVLQFSKKDMPFVLAGGSTTVGWNYLELFDNSNILSHPASESVVYPIALDELVVGNEYAGPPAIPENISATLINDTTIKVKWRAGNNGAVYPLTGYRIYCTDTNKVTATYDVGNVTEFDVTGLTNASQYKFAVTALNLDSFGSQSESLRPPMVNAITLLAGDLTGDLVVGVEDALFAMQIATGQRTANAAELKAGDLAPLVGGVPAPNGIIDTGDAIVILAVVAGLRRL